MSDVRDRIQETMHYVASVMPPNTGIVLLAFDFGPNGKLEYSSNARREDVVQVMREFIARAATEKSWMRHIDDGPAAPGA